MVLLLVAVLVFIVTLLVKLNKDYYLLALAKRVKTIDGSPLEKTAPVSKCRTIFGNNFDVFGFNNAAVFAHTRKQAAEFKKSYIQYFFGGPFYNVITPEDAELVLNDSNLIAKGIFYKFVQPFLGEGLLMSTDKKWHSRRKLLTPAFHFNILGQFEDIFKEESLKFVKNIEAQTSDVVSLNDLVPKFTLNSVCETALGVKLDERLDGKQYFASFKMIEELFVKRISNPLYMSDTIFNIAAGWKYEPHLRMLHEFSSNIIAKRRQLFAEEKLNNAKDSLPADDDIDLVGKKKRYAMLDTLLYAEQDGLIDHRGICEEVDTFMFEGFDTTSMGLIFSLMNLSLYPEMQEKCYQELQEFVDDDLNNLDISQLNNLKYLECFLKESLRLYPSVPLIMRKTLRETKLANNLILPESTQIVIHLFDILRDPTHFPKPNDFNPDRFTPANSAGRHPFAYTPFSAGQRNCIGQKFAMLEMKTLLVYVLKHYQLLPMVNPEEFVFESGIITRTTGDIKIKLLKRR